MAVNDFQTLFQKYRLRAVVFMAGCTILVTILSLIAHVMWIEHMPGSGTALVLFSLNREMSLGTWWSATVLAGLGALTGLICLLQSDASRSERLALLTLAAGFVFLSIDETCMLHERLGGKIHVEGLMHHARWAVIWLPPALLITGVVMWRLWRTRKKFVIGMCLGIVIYLGGAVGMESFNSTQRVKAESHLGIDPADTVDTNQSFVPDDWRRDRAYYPFVIGTNIEEFLEMLGPLIWLWVLLDWNNLKSQAQDRKRENTIVPAKPLMQPKAAITIKH